MSDTAIAIIVLPFLVALVAVLECTRIGCTKLARKVRETKVRSPQLQHGSLKC